MEGPMLVDRPSTQSCPMGLSSLPNTTQADNDALINAISGLSISHRRDFFDEALSNATNNFHMDTNTDEPESERERRKIHLAARRKRRSPSPPKKSLTTSSPNNEIFKIHKHSVATKKLARPIVPVTKMELNKKKSVDEDDMMVDTMENRPKSNRANFVENERSRRLVLWLARLHKVQETRRRAIGGDDKVTILEEDMEGLEMEETASGDVVMGSVPSIPVIKTWGAEDVEMYVDARLDAAISGKGDVDMGLDAVYQ